MAEVKGISINVEMNTDKLQLKLRTIAKHAEELANELDAIDNGWECPNCNASDYSDMYLGDKLEYRQCNKCNHAYTGENVELPTRIEGSE